jgi:NAD-dependent DNA ligase
LLKFPSRFTAKDKIELSQRFFLVNSYLYYELNTSIISDYRFDEECQQLYQFKMNHPKEFSEARYSYVMGDFEGNTGFGYVKRLNEKDKKSIIWHAETMIRE